MDILPALLLPLAGPEQFTEEEMDQFPVELQYLSDDKQRDPDPGIRKMCIEAIMKVCSHTHTHPHMHTHTHTYMHSGTSNLHL